MDWITDFYRKGLRAPPPPPQAAEVPQYPGLFKVNLKVTKYTNKNLRYVLYSLYRQNVLSPSRCAYTSSCTSPKFISKIQSNKHLYVNTSLKFCTGLGMIDEY